MAAPVLVPAVPTPAALHAMTGPMLEAQHAVACTATGRCEIADIRAWCAVADAYFAEIGRRTAEEERRLGLA